LIHNGKTHTHITDNEYAIHNRARQQMKQIVEETV